jgi:hypothetical protein
MNALLDRLDVPFTFSPQPSSLPGDLRITWRIALVLLILLHSRSQKASLQKLHVMNWASRTAANRRLFFQFARNVINKDQLVPRIEPSLNRAVDFALAEELIRIENAKNLKLTSKGYEAAQQIDEAIDCLTEEKSFLKAMARFFTERNIDDLLNWNLTT